MNAPYFQPLVGRQYKNQNGTVYLCIGAGLTEHEAQFISTYSGWKLTAHGCHQAEDETIWWDGSTGKGFVFEAPVNIDICADKKFMGSRGYCYHICGIKTSEGFVEKNTYYNSESSFCKEVVRIFADYWNPRIIVTQNKEQESK